VVADGQLIPVKPVAAPTVAGRLQVDPFTVLMKLEPLVTAKHVAVPLQLIAPKGSPVFDVWALQLAPPLAVAITVPPLPVAKHAEVLGQLIEYRF